MVFEQEVCWVVTEGIEELDSGSCELYGSVSLLDD